MAGSWQPPAAFNVVSTLAVLAAAVALTWLAWNCYEHLPWTRDGRVRVYTVRVAPEVSGTVVDLSVKDNQFVHKGDVLFRIDPGIYQNAVKQAEGKLAQAWKRPCWPTPAWSSRATSPAWAAASTCRTPRRGCRDSRASAPCSPGCAWRNGSRSGWSWTTCPARSCCPSG